MNYSLYASPPDPYFVAGQKKVNMELEDMGWTVRLYFYYMLNLE